MILTQLQAAAVVATLRRAPLGEGDAVRVAYNFPGGRIVSVVMDSPEPGVRVNEYDDGGDKHEFYATVEEFAQVHQVAEEPLRHPMPAEQRDRVARKVSVTLDQIHAATEAIGLTERYHGVR